MKPAVSVTDMGHGDIWQMAQSARLCLHYSHWSREEEEEKGRLIPAASGAGEAPPPHVPSLQTHLGSRTAGNIHRLFGLDQHAHHTLCSCGLARPGHLLLAFLKRVKAAAFTEYTARSLCLRSSAPPLWEHRAGRCYLSAAVSVAAAPAPARRRARRSSVTGWTLPLGLVLWSRPHQIRSRQYEG